MKIGIFVDVFYPMIDGVIKVVDNYATRLSKVADVTVFCPKSSDESYKDDFPYKVVRCNALFFKKYDYAIPTPNFDRNFIDELNKSDLDIVHIHSPFSVGQVGVNYAKNHGVPVVATLHSQYKQDCERVLKLKSSVDIGMFFIMQTFNACNECYAVNDSIRALYVYEYNLKAPCFVRKNATSHTPIEDKKSAYKFVNEKFGLREDETVLLFVGRINYLKNIQLIARSLKILKDKGYEFKMLFVGTGQDENEFKKLLEKLAICDRVIMCGKIAEAETLEKIYARAKLFLFPSLYDANSLVQIEAACQGTPTVFLRGAKTAGTVTEDVNGFIADQSDEAFAEKIEQILTDDEYYRKVAEGAKRDLYVTWDEVVSNVYKDYGRLIAKKKAGII